MPFFAATPLSAGATVGRACLLAVLPPGLAESLGANLLVLIYVVVLANLLLQTLLMQPLVPISCDGAAQRR